MLFKALFFNSTNNHNIHNYNNLQVWTNYLSHDSNFSTPSLCLIFSSRNPLTTWLCLNSSISPIFSSTISTTLPTSPHHLDTSTPHTLSHLHNSPHISPLGHLKISPIFSLTISTTLPTSHPHLQNCTDTGFSPKCLKRMRQWFSWKRDSRLNISKIFCVGCMLRIFNARYGFLFFFTQLNVAHMLCSHSKPEQRLESGPFLGNVACTFTTLITTITRL